MLAFLFAVVATLVQVPTLGYQHLLDADGVETTAFVSVIGTHPLVTAAISPALDPTAPAAPAAADAVAKPQTLSTPVYDAISDTYSTVETTKAAGETETDFIRRHNGLVHALVANNKADAKREGIDYDKAKKEHDGASSG